MTLKDIELELIELRKEHEAMAEVVKHHIKNFDKLRNWHKLESQADVVVMPFKALAYGARFKFRNCKDGKTWIKMFDNTICEYNKDYINHKNWLGQQIALADFDDITEFVA